MSIVSKPSVRPWNADSTQYWFQTPNFNATDTAYAKEAMPRHTNKVNVTFFDGHLERMVYNDLKTAQDIKL